MKVLSVNFGHDASLCLFVDGVLKDFCEVERESRLKHHFGLTSEVIVQYLKRLNDDFHDFDLVAISGTQNWGVYHSVDISVGYGYTDAHSKYCRPQPQWTAENYRFFDGVGSEYVRHVERGRFNASPTPMRLDWAPAFRNLSGDVHIIGKLAQGLLRSPPESRRQIQGRFLAPLTLTIGNVAKPGFFVDHHAAHANYAGYYSGAHSIIVTHDGGLSYPFHGGGVYLFDKAAGALPFASHRLTLGNIYERVALNFGIDPGKLMGLSAYARPNQHVDAVIRQYVESLHDESALPPSQTAAMILKSAQIDKVLREKAIEKFQFDFQDVVLAIQAAANAQHFVQQVYVGQIGPYCEKISLCLDEYSNVLMTGGFSLNCPTNTAISQSYPGLNFRPLPGVADTGLSLGAAVALHYFLRLPLEFNCSEGAMAPAFPPSCLDHNASDESMGALMPVDIALDSRIEFIADSLLQGKIVCLHRGRSEVGPRALGRRSIIAWAGAEENRDRINRSKQRESWRPLAPICSIEDFHDYFVGEPEECRFMLTTSKVKSRAIPAVTHVDNTARVQVIDADDELLYGVLACIKNRGFAPVIVNTSFNCAGEPLVETLADAARSFVKMKFDYLVTEMGTYRLNQPDKSRTIESDPSAFGTYTPALVD